MAGEMFKIQDPMQALECSVDCGLLGISCSKEYHQVTVTITIRSNFKVKRNIQFFFSPCTRLLYANRTFSDLVITWKHVPETNKNHGRHKYLIPKFLTNQGTMIKLFKFCVSNFAMWQIGLLTHFGLLDATK